MNQDPVSTRPGATTAQLKNDIDSGRTGDKLAGFDPGATPLGVDDEAGGVSPDPHLIAATRAQERSGRPDSPTPNASTPELQPNARGARTSYALPAIAGVTAAAAVALLLLAAL
ncbi:hypothetical protein [Phenylobacterium sp.]|uniref:hypothetical protein n=1 Tax=Phenylobacterium sp. TaxID=1871053 RepID=UPI002811F088|nr:hypothetical protein [Phenylobacterium sp.]